MGRKLSAMIPFLLILLIPFFYYSATLDSSTEKLLRLIDRLKHLPASGPFTPFTPLTKEKGIDNPVQVWTYDMPKDPDEKDFFSTEIFTDGFGRPYIRVRDSHLYALDQEGKLRWENDAFFANPWDKMILSNEGMIKVGEGKLNLLDYDNKLIWKRSRYTSNFHISPDGFVVISGLYALQSYDSKGKIKWYASDKNISDINMGILECFFDNKNNSYYLAHKADLESPNIGVTNIFSLTAEGKFRWKKKLDGTELVSFFNSFFPGTNNLIHEVFLLNFDYYEKDSDIERDDIAAFDCDGNQLWSYSMAREGYRAYTEGSYSIGKDKNFYLCYNHMKHDEVNWEENQANLICLSPEGKLIWKKTFPGVFDTAPVLDDQDHLYLSLSSSEDCFISFYSNGTEKWRIKTERGMGFIDSLTLGSNRSLYGFSESLGRVFCIRDKEAAVGKQ
jgi:hypothetical protein